MGNDNYKQGSDFFMTFSGKKEKSILDFPTKSLQNTLTVSAATCKANGICFRKWLEDVLPRLTTTPAGQMIDSLIPGARQSSQ